ncbi:MAG: hypothetical protein Q4B40_00725 [Clostridia bacterium]|nr:hypothetical protein [Clostridia bacterium]
MVKTLLLIFLVLFAVSGICELIYFLKMMFYYPNLRVHNYSLIILKSGNAVRQLNFVWQKLRWYGEDFSKGIIAVVDNLDTAEILNCTGFANDKKIVLCTASLLMNCEVLQRELLNGNDR